MAESFPPIDPVPEPNPPQKPALVITIESWATPFVGLGMLLLGLVVGYLGRPVIQSVDSTSTPSGPVANPAASPAVQQPRPTVDTQGLMTMLVENTRHFRGDPNAPVTMLEFSDFQWTFCGRFATGEGRQIEEKYVDTGIVRIGYIHYPFLGAESQWAAEASECAADQDAFWEYHDLLFDTLMSGDNPGFSKDNLKQFAADLGIDTQEFNQCLDSEKHAETVQLDLQIGQQIGVRSTPSFIINGTPLVGSLPMESFEEVILQAQGQ